MFFFTNIKTVHSPLTLSCLKFNVFKIKFRIFQKFVCSALLKLKYLFYQNNKKGSSRVDKIKIVDVAISYIQHLQTQVEIYAKREAQFDIYSKVEKQNASTNTTDCVDERGLWYIKGLFNGSIELIAFFIDFFTKNNQQPAQAALLPTSSQPTSTTTIPIIPLETPSSPHITNSLESNIYTIELLIDQLRKFHDIYFQANKLDEADTKFVTKSCTHRKFPHNNSKIMKKVLFALSSDYHLSNKFYKKFFKRASKPPAKQHRSSLFRNSSDSDSSTFSSSDSDQNNNDIYHHHHSLQQQQPLKNSNINTLPFSSTSKNIPMNNNYLNSRNTNTSTTSSSSSSYLLPNTNDIDTDSGRFSQYSSSKITSPMTTIIPNSEMAAPFVNANNSNNLYQVQSRMVNDENVIGRVSSSQTTIKNVKKMKSNLIERFNDGNEENTLFVNHQQHRFSCNPLNNVSANNNNNNRMASRIQQRVDQGCLTSKRPQEARSDDDDDDDIESCGGTDSPIEIIG